MTTTDVSRILSSICPHCHSIEIDSPSPFTLYECGTRTYDGRPHLTLRGADCETLRSDRIGRCGVVQADGSVVCRRPAVAVAILADERGVRRLRSCDRHLERSLRSAPEFWVLNAFGDKLLGRSHLLTTVPLSVLPDAIRARLNQLFGHEELIGPEAPVRWDHAIAACVW